MIEKGRVKDNFVSRVPLISQNFWMGDPLQVQSTRYSEAMPNVNGRRNRIWTAEGLGGASRINAMLVTRGVPGGYQEWAEDFGLDEWGWDQVEPFFRKSEKATAHPKSTSRGHDGMSHTSADNVRVESYPDQRPRPHRAPTIVLAIQMASLVSNSMKQT